MTRSLLRYFVALCALALISFPLHSAPKTFKLAVEIAPPFTVVDENKKVTGLSVDLVGELMKAVGAKLEVLTCPWARCMKMAKEGEADFIFGILKTKERMQHFSFVEPHFISSITEVTFYKLKTADFSVNHLTDVQKKLVGFQRGAVHFDAFDKSRKISKVAIKDIRTMIQMLQKGRIDLFVMPKVSAEQYLREHDKANQITQVNYVYAKEQGGYIALSRQSEFATEIGKLSEAFSQLKRAGKIQTILEKYGLTQ